MSPEKDSFLSAFISEMLREVATILDQTFMPHVCEAPYTYFCMQIYAHDKDVKSRNHIAVH